MKIKRMSILCISLLITLFLLAVFGEDVQAAKGVITARMGMIAPEGHPVAVASARFAKLVEQRTGGRIKVLTFPGGTLGGETELIDLVQSGVLEMANIGISGAYSPRFEAPVCLFYLFPNEDAMWQFYGSMPYKEELLRVQRQRNTIMLSMNWWQGWRHVITNRPVKKVEDFKGLKLRYPVVDNIKAKFYAALGAKGGRAHRISGGV